MRLGCVNIVAFLVVCRQAFADGVGVGAQSALENVVLAFGLSPDIVVFDAVVSGNAFAGRAEVLAELALEDGVLLCLVDRELGQCQVIVTDLLHVRHPCYAGSTAFGNRLLPVG